MEYYIFCAVLFGCVLGIYGERLRQGWVRREWRARFAGRRQQSGPITDGADQLRLVTAAAFSRSRLLSPSETRVFEALERAIEAERMPWRVMAQVNLGEFLRCKDRQAFGAINSKRVDMLIIDDGGMPVAACEYQGGGHYQSDAPTRDAVKREALRKAGIEFTEIKAGDTMADLRHAVARLVRVNRSASASPSEVSDAVAANQITRLIAKPSNRRIG